ncbi:tigger transposable element-derived protein 6-like, partial [Copidosoma floridanum]|uniref:tigger transposable element-derived protein 6-like n=1 Tax=Copidosoma floridanum TaxID=29053 RepID=UPI0006C9CCC5
AERGYPVTKTKLLDSVKACLDLLGEETIFINNSPSRHWYEAFRKRHPQLSIRKPQQLKQQKYLEIKHLLDISAERVYNCDETSVPLCPESEKVLAAKGSRNIYNITDASKESITVLFTYSALGTRTPPMIMFKYIENLPLKNVGNTPKGWGIGTSDSGWMTTETFFEYVTNVFHPWLLKQQIEFPVILYLDGHSSHVTIPLVSFCREHQIELIALLPNCTHTMQPLDISYFHPFIDMWKK